MAKLNFFIMFTFFIVLCDARTTPSTTSTTSTIIDKKSYGNFSGHVCDQERYSKLGMEMKDFTFCDASLSYEVRVKDLIDRMTLEEKVRQLGDTAYGVPRLGLPLYEWWSEALHGVADVGQEGSKATYFDDVVPGATSFPNVINTAASFNESLWKAIGEVVSTEARAMYNLGHAGLTFWSPNINVVRDPRWGRALETPGEDPFVVGVYGYTYVRGLQDIKGTENATDLNARPLKIGACCKHYAAYDLDLWLGANRRTFDARVHQQDMVETFQRPFEMCVKEGDVASVMCSFNEIDGIPACADRNLLTDTFRGEWNLHGYIVSDCDSVKVMFKNEQWLHDTPEDAVAQALNAGLDLDCGFYYKNYTGNAIVQGKVRETVIDNALTNLYTVLMRLGWFDGNKELESLRESDICSEKNIELATEAAREGIVLLKNANDTLPLNPHKHKTIAVVGPHANATEIMIGNYAGEPCKYTSPIDGLSMYAKVNYQMGCGDVACKNESMIYQSMEAAKDADATIVVVGLALEFEREEHDRTDLLLPGYQHQLIEQVSKLSKGPTIVVVMSGGVVDVTHARDSNHTQAMLWAGYPGQEGGRAIADVIFGKHNPGGRLPLTWYPSNYTDTLPMTSMQLRPHDGLGFPGRTYKFYNGSTVFPFGHGLSYTQFVYKLKKATRKVDIKLSKFQHCRDLNYTTGMYKPPCPAVKVEDMKCDEHIEFEVEIYNKGSRDGTETAIVYSVPPKNMEGVHIKQVVGFKSVLIHAKKSATVKFDLNVCKSFFIVNYNAYRLLPSGQHTIMIGDKVLSFPVHIKIEDH
ncbi:beta-xylosidase/alpha-L-arabinofuranosidase 1-like [Apium graveolens]|uniref:beta-xylosidase/alpha-L-arabinofuranosidase 1-like n=1 Tax=Apium graveolens TaxID=4045 RepID=UPI003D78DFAD